jgi:hypothetical protein
METVLSFVDAAVGVSIHPSSPFAKAFASALEREGAIGQGRA